MGLFRSPCLLSMRICVFRIETMYSNDADGIISRNDAHMIGCDSQTYSIMAFSGSATGLRKFWDVAIEKKAVCLEPDTGERQLTWRRAASEALSRLNCECARAKRPE
jgi:hypothetical protein